MECPISKSTVSAILEVDIPDEYFTKDISSKYTFSIKPVDWNRIYETRKGRQLKRDVWESVFFQGINSSNPYCCFKVTRSQLSSASRRKRRGSVPLFKADACCIFKDCSVKLRIAMTDSLIVNLNYSGDIKHNIYESHQRFIKGQDRDDLKKDFRGGNKPLAVY